MLCVYTCSCQYLIAEKTERVAEYSHLEPIESFVVVVVVGCGNNIYIYTYYV